MAEGMAAGSEADPTTGTRKPACSLAEFDDTDLINLLLERLLPMRISRQFNIAITLHHLSCTLTLNAHSTFPVAIAR